MRKSLHKLCGLRPKVALSGSELDARDPDWATTPSIVDAERQLAVAVIGRAFMDLHLPIRDKTDDDGGKKLSAEIYENKRIRNSALLFLTSGPDRREWYDARLYWATAAGYCQNKIKNKALAICEAENIRILPVNDDVDAPYPEGAEIFPGSPMISRLSSVVPLSLPHANVG